MAETNLPQYQDWLPCANCGGETKSGFGLAGGGYGPYTYCERCGMIVTKTQERENPNG